MLTIRVIASDGGELVQEVSCIRVTPDHECQPNYKRLTYYWNAGKGGIGENFVSSGQVYVMNESGKTIADYWLGE
jgi:hypothetical protein